MAVLSLISPRGTISITQTNDDYSADVRLASDGGLTTSGDGTYNYLRLKIDPAEGNLLTTDSDGVHVSTSGLTLDLALINTIEAGDGIEVSISETAAGRKAEIKLAIDPAPENRITVSANGLKVNPPQYIKCVGDAAKAEYFGIWVGTQLPEKSVLEANENVLYFAQLA